jgi:hypothetical protein
MINGLYKAGVIHRGGPRRSFEAVEYATLEWVDWFNHRRLLEPSATSCLPKPNGKFMLPRKTSIWQRDSQPYAPDKPRAVQAERRRPIPQISVYAPNVILSRGDG